LKVLSWARAKRDDRDNATTEPASGSFPTSTSLHSAVSL
jgi:hypothetical protein